MLRVQNSQIITVGQPAEKGRLAAKAWESVRDFNEARAFEFFAEGRSFSIERDGEVERSGAMSVQISQMRDVHFEQNVEQIEQAFLQVGERLSFTFFGVVKDCCVAVYEAFATPEKASVSQALRGIAI